MNRPIETEASRSNFNELHVGDFAAEENTPANCMGQDICNDVNKELQGSHDSKIESIDSDFAMQGNAAVNDARCDTSKGRKLLNKSNNHGVRSIKFDGSQDHGIEGGEQKEVANDNTGSNNKNKTKGFNVKEDGAINIGYDCFKKDHVTVNINRHDDENRQKRFNKDEHKDFDNMPEDRNFEYIPEDEDFGYIQEDEDFDYIQEDDVNLTGSEQFNESPGQGYWDIDSDSSPEEDAGLDDIGNDTNNDTDNAVSDNDGERVRQKHRSDPSVGKTDPVRLSDCPSQKSKGHTHIQHDGSEHDEGPPTKFTIAIGRREWKTICPTKNCNRLRNEWSDLLYNKFSKVNKRCVLVFIYNRSKKPGSRKRKGAFVRVVGKCKFKGCCKYVFSLKSPPTTKQSPVKLTVCQIGTINHNIEDHEKRHMKGSRRKNVASSLKEKGVSNWYYEAVSSMSHDEKKAGNFTACSSTDVLRKVLSEHNRLGHLDPDMLQEVKLLQEVYREVYAKSQFTNGGFIQYFSCCPFKVHMFLDDQIQLYRNSSKDRANVLYLDATGSLVKKIPGQDKQILYYALVMENPVPGKAAIPVCEMLSNDQHASEIKHFLTRFINAAGKGKLSGSTVPRRVEIDFSWAMIQSVLSAFNGEDCKSYLTRTYHIVTGKHSESKIEGFTYPHMCAAHMIKDISQHLRKETEDKQKKQFALYCFALLQTATSLQEGKEIFAHMCRVFQTPKKSASMLQSLQNLQQLIMKSGLENDVDEDTFQEDVGRNENGDICAERQDSIKNSSPWRKEFLVVCDTAARPQQGIEGVEVCINEYEMPGFIQVLLDNFLHVFPLWSAVLLGDLTRYASDKDVHPSEDFAKRATNGLIENWFGNIKKDFLPGGRNRLRPGEFVRKQYVNITGRLGEVEMKHTYRNRKTKHENGDEKECWSKRTPSKQRKEGKYFTSPFRMPAPKQKETPMKERKTTSKQTAQRSPRKNDTPATTSTHKLHRNDSVPKWGGEVIYKGKTICMDNTCTIDNLIFLVSRMLEKYPRVKLALQGSHDDVCRKIVTVSEYGQNGNWDMAKFTWLHRVCKYELQVQVLQTWNAYGSEHVAFVQYLGGVQASTRSSNCSSDDCPQKQTVRNTNDIELQG
ncbi:hypothetical protein HOLleu_21770 [Holothuria leucospilota]|uniref:Uncharacterized protein n=1 Tax=Holothuria leucospilota TaxID=206669 RepID=A0A9Q1H6A8_HOLLE|nr:hypothetical protein HOLleu_21770 [Holothuria leucospilota]